MLRARPHTLAPPAPPYPPRAHSDTELIAALVPLAEDYVARLRADRERHGGDAARMAACARLAKYYGLVHQVCEDAADEWRKAGAA